MTPEDNEKITSRYTFEPGRFDHLRERVRDCHPTDALNSWPINEALLNQAGVEPEWIDRVVVTNDDGAGITLVIPEAAWPELAAALERGDFNDD